MNPSDVCRHGSCGCEQQDRGRAIIIIITSKVLPVLDHTLMECGERQSGEVPLHFRMNLDGHEYHSLCLTLLWTCSAAAAAAAAAVCVCSYKVHVWVDKAREAVRIDMRDGVDKTYFIGVSPAACCTHTMWPAPTNAVSELGGC
jgi:hypothetical protein